MSWTHFRSLIYLDDPLHRDFYAEMCRVERWSTRTLRDKIQGMLFERTGISRKPDELARQEVAALRESDRMTPDLVFRDPYLLGFLGLADTYSEKDLEAAILRELEQFLLELGSDFSFVARQKRITVDGEDYYLDLLFYHRRTRGRWSDDLFEPATRRRGLPIGNLTSQLRCSSTRRRSPGSQEVMAGVRGLHGAPGCAVAESSRSSWPAGPWRRAE